MRRDTAAEERTANAVMLSVAKHLCRPAAPRFEVHNCPGGSRKAPPRTCSSSPRAKRFQNASATRRAVLRDGNACTTDTCDPATGCVETPVACAAGEHCGVTGECVPDTLCPCFDAADIDLMVQTCGDRSLGVQCEDIDGFRGEVWIGCAPPEYDAVTDHENSGFAFPFCRLRDNADGSPSTFLQPISATQKAACLEVLRQKQAEHGVCAP